MNDFLPKGYDLPPAQSSYMKFKVGENRFRALSSSITGWEYWVEEGKSRKPKRIPNGQSVPLEELNKYGVDPSTVKHFWAFVVWNYGDRQIQILEVTQKGIQKAISALARDNDWGSPKGYDIVITKEGDGLETEYTVNPKPAKPLEREIAEEYSRRVITLEKLFTGENPFEQ